MDIPDLVQRKLGDEEIQAGVSLGDEDAVCLTSTRTLVYRGEGLLSDEQIEEYPHDVEQIRMSEGRRKTKFTLQYIEGTKTFTVPANRGEKVLELFLEGVLRLDDVIEPRESIVGVYHFSELTVIITERRLIKHIGEQVWNEDYESYPFEDVTHLEFERASVATSIALSVDGRPQRVKIPNDQAPIVRQTLERALFAYYDVDSLDALNRVVDDDATAGAESADSSTSEADESDDFEFGDDFDPLVGRDDDDELTESVDTDDPLSEDRPASGDGETTATQSGDVSATADSSGGQTGASDAGTDAHAADTGVTHDASGTSGDRPGTSGDRPTEMDDADTATTDASRTDRNEQPSPSRDPAAASDGPGTGVERAESGVETAEGGVETAEGGVETAEARDETADATTPVAGSDGLDATHDATEAATPQADVDPAISREEFEAVVDRLDELTEAVERQNELLKRQHQAIKQLIKQQRSD